MVLKPDGHEAGDVACGCYGYENRDTAFPVDEAVVEAIDEVQKHYELHDEVNARKHPRGLRVAIDRVCSGAPKKVVGCSISSVIMTTTKMVSITNTPI
jgi:microcompartment protein CcmK/EutM